ncbi:MAG: hypothetical protein KatS3mg101_0482 [Patescibacteria group bacterium]|nr:MAG: hypothetical protein KatS3mg101_0482 [Patescibacteria group bacterium]
MATKKKTTKTQRKVRKNTECYFTQTGTTPDYKEVLVLRRFISDRGKIIPQKYSGVTSTHQRKLAREIKRARYMGLIPYTERHSI